MNWLFFTFMELLIFLWVLLFVEAVSLEWTHVWISLMIIFIADTLEHIRTRLSYLDFQSRQVDLVIHLVIPSKLPMVFQLMRSVAFDTLRALDPAESHCMILLPAVFTLRNAWVHICSINHCNEAPNVEVSVNQAFGLRTTLDISDIDLNDRHVRFREDLDNSWPQC